MSDKFVVYPRKIVNNPLLGRKQAQIEIIHPEQGNVSKALLKERLAVTFKGKVENIAIFGLHSKFGGGRSTGFACIYNSADDRKKYDQKSTLLRDGFITKKKITRKQGKEIKGRVKRVRGTKKTQAAAAGGAKKKK